MDQIPSWDADSHKAGQWSVSLLLISKFHFRVYKSRH
jgi:hypothetical protein